MQLPGQDFFKGCLSPTVNDGDKLYEFVATIVLNKKHPAYKEGKVTISKENSEKQILLPALVYPIFPNAYQAELNRFCPVEQPEPAQLSKKRVKNSPNHKHCRSTERRIDGIPYNPEDFNFPLSSKQKEKLEELSELLGYGNPLQKRRPLCSPLLDMPTTSKYAKKGKEFNLKVHLHPKIGNYMNERLALIQRNQNYQKELRDIINDKITSKDNFPSKVVFDPLARRGQMLNFAGTRGRSLMALESGDLSNI